MRDKKKKRIYIYGTGSGAERYYEIISNDSNIKIIGFLDRNSDKNNKKIMNNIVYNPEKIDRNNFDEIIIASEYSEIKNYLLNLGFNNNKIKFIYDKALINYVNNEIEENIKYVQGNYVLNHKMEYKMKNTVENSYLEMNDYTRYKILELVAEEINNNNIEGCIAEVGVYRGDFAKIMNQVFKDKKMFLFDTFEGFEEDQQEYDINNGYFNSEFLNKCNFKDTSIELVIEKMLYPEKCVIKKGFFPDTAKDVDEKFSFVSIDVDLYKSIYDSIEYFYPRLERGGYIFIHDYKNSEFFGVRRAIKDYEMKNGRLSKVPISDHGGTIIITK